MNESLNQPHSIYVTIEAPRKNKWKNVTYGCLFGLGGRLVKLIESIKMSLGHCHTECLSLHQASGHLPLRTEHCHRLAEEPKRMKSEKENYLR